MWQKLRLEWYLRGTSLLKGQLYKEMVLAERQAQIDREKLLQMFQLLQSVDAPSLVEKSTVGFSTVYGAFRWSK